MCLCVFIVCGYELHMIGCTGLLLEHQTSIIVSARLKRTQRDECPGLPGHWSILRRGKALSCDARRDRRCHLQIRSMMQVWGLRMTQRGHGSKMARVGKGVTLGGEKLSDSRTLPGGNTLHTSTLSRFPICGKTRGETLAFTRDPRFLCGDATSS